MTEQQRQGILKAVVRANDSMRDAYEQAIAAGDRALAKELFDAGKAVAGTVPRVAKANNVREDRLS